MSFSPVPASRAPIRRRRFFIFVALFVALLFFYGVPWELPTALKEIRFEALSRASIVYHTKSETSKVDEIYGLIYMVTEDVERDLTRVGNIDPLEPLNMTVYAGDESINWPKTVKKLNKKYPVVVFSKSYCPYSRRAKKLLETYHIQPAPKVVEVDLRVDDDIIKAILGRTTQHHTFPNILIRGKSIGGSDDLQALHAERTLTRVLEQAGASVRNSGTGK
ncbi:Glutaredoxin-C6 [Termitomyces sp. T112]|nr:Glutaredoxin-C6 [Termitomyces sp. T112]